MKKLLLVSLLSLCMFNLAYADDLLATAAAEGNFKTFLSAAKTTGLEETLKGAGPFTLFLPNDAAFAKIPKGKLKALLANKEELTKLLTYHVFPGKISKAEVDAGKIKSLEGDDIELSVTDGVKVDHVKVVGTEINADNGVIHELESVLMLKKKK